MLTVASLLVTERARASEPEPIVLRYEAGPSCPSESAFVERVRAYTTRWSRVTDGSVAARSIRVRANAGPSSDRARGQLDVTSADGETSERTLTAPSCEALGEALAIMVAVAIDPSALMAHDAEPAPAPPDETDETDETAPPPDETPPVVTPSTTRPAPLDAPQHKVDAHADDDARPRISAALRAGVTSTVINAALPVSELSVGVEPSFEGMPPWIRPSLSVAWRQSLPTEVSLRGGTIEFLWTAGNVRLCPVGISIPRSAFDVSLCGEVDLGVLRAAARGFEDARKSSLFWLDWGASTHGSLALGEHAFVDASFAVLAPSAHSRRPFELSSGALVSRAPVVGLLAGAGVGLRF